MGTLPVVVVGAGPVGLALAAQLVERGLEPLVLESGSQVGAAVAAWGHVRIFSPWRYDVDPAARRLLERAGWTAPDPDGLPTGGELVERYLVPLAATPELSGRIRTSARVLAISRRGVDKTRSTGRDDQPFVVRVATASGVEDLLAGAVVDASGTWQTPNPLGAGGLPAIGEHDAGERLTHALPDVLGADRARFAGRHTVVVGNGHSASNTLLALAQLAEEVPGTRMTWVIRGRSAARTYGGGTDDQLPARAALGSRLRRLVESGAVEFVPGFHVERVDRDGDGVTLGGTTPAGDRSIHADVIVSATGFRPDLDLIRELRIEVDPVTEAPPKLAPLIDPNVHSCGTVPPHGARELAQPEPGFYVVGSKSYGRAPTFLMLTGYEQARSVAAALAGDHAAAESVELTLPQTGVCGGSSADDGCCDVAAGPQLISLSAAPARS